MRCTRARTLLAAAILDAADHPERSQLTAHLAHCASCRAEFEGLRTVDGAVRALGVEAEVPAGLEAAVMRAIQGARAGDVGSARWPLRLPTWAGLPALAGGVAAVLVLALLWGTRVPPPAQLAFDETPVPSGEALRMADGRAHGTPEDGAPAPRPTTVARAPRPASAGVTPAQPPADLAAALDLLLELPLVENLEKLQNYDVIESATLAGEGESNG